jgi:hypothetical protein
MSIPNGNTFYKRKKLAEVELCEGLVEIGDLPSGFATIQLRKSTSPTHSGGLTIVLSIALFEQIFVFTIALKVSVEMHSLPAFSPTSKFHP